MVAVAAALISCGGNKSESLDDDEDLDLELTESDYSISSSVDDEETYSYEDDDDDSDNSSSKDWDSLLDSYDQYVDKYIACVKKASKGDMNALSEYADLMEKAEEFSDQISGAQGDMTSSQWSRYMRITNKMTKAAADML